MKWFLVDASVSITLAEIDRVQVLEGLDGNICMPDAVAAEIEPNPSKTTIEGQKRRLIATNTDWLDLIKTHQEPERAFDYAQYPKTEKMQFRKAANHLGEEPPGDWMTGDVALLGIALGWKEESTDEVIITDDKPLRKTCKALGIPISGSFGVLIAAVERGDLDPDEAKAALVAMDEAGARLSARLLRKAERLIDEAAEKRGE